MGSGVDVLKGRLGVCDGIGGEIGCGRCWGVVVRVDPELELALLEVLGLISGSVVHASSLLLLV